MLVVRDHTEDNITYKDKLEGVCVRVDTSPRTSLDKLCGENKLVSVTIKKFKKTAAFSPVYDNTT